MTPTSTPDPDWCTTAHGSTIHPDDEDHRSAGITVPVDVRAPGSRSATHTDVEVGLLRRRGDDETWVVIEDGLDVRLELTVTSARRIVQAIRDHLALTSALD